MSSAKLKSSDFVDIMNEGIIHVDTTGRIHLYNEKAKEIIGIKRHSFHNHPPGTLEKGDVVILAITTFGADDDGLEVSDLKKIGINLKEIDHDATLIAIGEYGDNGSNGFAKLRASNSNMDVFNIDKTFKNVNYKVKINHGQRKVEIRVNGKTYKNYYNNFFSHCLILDGNTHEVKFYQQGGYTAWKEDLPLIMNGGCFSEKKIGYNILDVIDRNILDFHNKSEIIEDLLKCASGESSGYIEKNGKINGIGVVCAVKPVVRDGIRIGAILIIGDITRLRNAEHQRNLAYIRLKKAQDELNDTFLENRHFSKIVGSSKGIVDIKKMAYKASISQSNVLILGESGTGKSILARAIHETSRNKDQPFIQVNCNSVPESLMESEFFGYEKGAFTGAHTKGKKGYFEMANGGTIFLDEIGDISKNMQVKLLRVIQSKKFYRVGSNNETKVDVRIIVATNRNLENDIRSGEFREDLYYRINVFPIHIPPLRERVSDIRELVEDLLPKISRRVGTDVKRLSGESLNKMMIYDWPGNVRELENVLERAVNLCDDKNILSEYIKVKIPKRNITNRINYIRPLKATLDEFELEVVQNVLQYVNGDKKKAMEILDIKKTSFYEKMKKIEKN